MCTIGGLWSLLIKFEYRFVGIRLSEWSTSRQAGEQANEYLLWLVSKQPNGSQMYRNRTKYFHSNIDITFSVAISTFFVFFLLCRCSANIYLNGGMLCHCSFSIGTTSDRNDPNYQPARLHSRHIQRRGRSQRRRVGARLAGWKIEWLIGISKTITTS